MRQLPPYVYSLESGSSIYLSQGDIISVKGELLSLFESYYPEITHADNTANYVMVLTQTCDLVRSTQRKPKVQHVVVCVIRTFSDYWDKHTKNIVDRYTTRDSNIKLIAGDRLATLREAMLKIINNTGDPKLFFLPKSEPLLKHKVALLNLSFPFRVEHYDKFLENRVLSLKPEFQAKVGSKLSSIYGRVATADLQDSQKVVASYVTDLLDDLKCISVPDETFIEYINDNVTYPIENDSIIQELINEKQSLIREKQFRKERKVLGKSVRDKLFQVFKNEKQCHFLLGLSDEALRREISSLLKGVL